MENNRKTGNNQLRNGVIILAVIAAVLAAGLFVLLGKSKPIVDLRDYMTIQAVGADGHAHIVIEADKDALAERVEKISGEVDFADNVINPTAEPAEGLKNGDTVAIVWSMPDKDYGIVFAGEKTEFVVEGLGEVVSADIFDDVNVVFEGIAAKGRVTVSCDKYDLKFETSKSEGLTNGEKITVTASALQGEDTKEYLMEQYGIDPVALSKEYEVTGLSSYIKRLSNVPQDVIDKMDEQIRAALAEDVSEWHETEIVDDVQLLGMYLFKPKKPTEGYPRNKLYMVYRVHYMNTKHGTDLHYYYWGSFDNVLKNGDGSIDVDYDVYDLTTHYYRVNSNYNYVDGFGTLEDLREALIDLAPEGTSLDSTVKE